MRKFLFSMGALLGAAAFLRHTARRIEGHEDRFPEEILRREPQGELVWVDRPDGTRLRAIVAGHGPSVMLTHGIMLTVLEWNVIALALLEAGYRVIAFDQRGHGESIPGSDGMGSIAMAGDYRAVLERLDAYNCVLVGHSMGGFLAITALLEDPAIAARLSGLVLAGAHAGRALDGAPQNRMQVPLLRTGLVKKVAATRTGAMLFGASLYGDHPSPAAIRICNEIFLRQDIATVLPILQACIDDDRYGRLAAIQLPTTIICGRKDRTTPPLHSERLTAGIAGSRLMWVEGAGHMLNWEAPEVLVGAIRDLAPTH